MKYQEVANKIAIENGWDSARFVRVEGGKEIYVCVSEDQERLKKECGCIPCTGLPDYVYVSDGNGRFVLGADYMREGMPE